MTTEHEHHDVEEELDIEEELDTLEAMIDNLKNRIIVCEVAMAVIAFAFVVTVATLL
jgi:hypothetical protein